MAKQRVIPKTSAVHAIGTCGHAFSTRYPTPGHLSGKPRTEEMAAALEVWRGHVSEILSVSACLNCRAEESLVHTRQQVSAWLDWLQVEGLADLEGASPRMVAFAEEVRASVLFAHISVMNSICRGAVNGPTLSRSIVIQLLRERWPDEVWLDIDEKGRGSAAGYTVKAGLPNYVTRLSLAVATPQRALALWLMLRESWLDGCWALKHETSARTWIAKKRARRASLGEIAYGLDTSSPPGSVSDALSIHIVAHLGHWGTPLEAWDAYQALRNPDVARMVQDSITHPTEATPSLSALIASGASMAALDGLAMRDQQQGRGFPNGVLGLV